MNWADEYLQMITDCQARNAYLNDWERGFLEGLALRLRAGGKITLLQTEKLDQIWQRVTDNGFARVNI